MKVFNSILGVFAILGSVYCMFFPGITFLNTGWIVATLLGVYGLCSIFEFFAGRKDKKNENKDAENNETEKKSKVMLADGVFGLIIGIAATVVSIIALVDVRTRLWLDVFILIMFAFWMVYSGISSIISSFTMKKEGGKLWILTLILGICVVLTGLFSATHLLFSALELGFIIGMGLMIYGIRLMASVFEKNA